MLVLPAPSGLELGVMRGAGAVTLGIGLWATRIIPEHLGTIIFFLVAVLFAVAPPEVVFVGFQSGALWLVFGGLVMGTAAERTGLGDRVAALTVRFLPSSYAGILSVLALIALLLGFFIPTGIGRIALLVPIVVALCSQLGFEPGSRGYVGLVLGTGMATISPTHSILTSNLPRSSSRARPRASTACGCRISTIWWSICRFSGWVDWRRSSLRAPCCSRMLPPPGPSSRRGRTHPGRRASADCSSS